VVQRYCGHTGQLFSCSKVTSKLALLPKAEQVKLPLRHILSIRVVTARPAVNP
jgi:hypothetical protein